MRRVNQIKKQQSAGFSLVELMVSLTLGLLILGLLVTVYLNNMQTNRFQNGLLRVQENGRFAVDMLTRPIRMAGYDDPATSAVVVPASGGIKGALLSADAPISLTDITTGTDIIAVTFEGGAGIRDCQGSSVPVDKVRTSQYAIQGSKLVCVTETDAVASLVTELAEGIEDMRIRYGVDPDDNGVPNFYVDSANVGANWNRIASVEITLLVNSIDNVLRAPENVCIGCTVFAGTADRMIRGEFQTVVAIRNLETP